jgi:hypothetical protein
MSRSAPSADCTDLLFPKPLPLPEPAELAVEDYALTLAGARSAEAIPGPDGVRGVHLCGLPGPLSAEVARDVRDFALGLCETGEGGPGLGWS